MITFSNITRYDDLPFEDYLQLPGYSHSFLKNEQFGMPGEVKETEKIMIGKLVDGILTDPNSVYMLHPLYKEAKAIAAYLQENFGFMITKLQKQISYTANMEYNGIVLQVKGRLDYLLDQFASVDLKVTSAPNVFNLIARMGYDNQTWLYSKMAKVPKRYLLVYSRYTNRADLIERPALEGVNEFWKESIMRFGRVAA